MKHWSDGVMECWSDGVLEYTLSITPPLESFGQYSITPVLVILTREYLQEHTQISLRLARQRHEVRFEEHQRSAQVGRKS